MLALYMHGHQKNEFNGKQPVKGDKMKIEEKILSHAIGIPCLFRAKLALISSIGFRMTIA